jgi:hypothetical protein
VGGIVLGTVAARTFLAELRRRTASVAAPTLLRWMVSSAETLASYVVRRGTGGNPGPIVDQWS